MSRDGSRDREDSSRPAPAARALTVLPLVAATYFMVAGGPYGLEELVQKAGYSQSILILLLTPILWSLPTALMVGELSAALPLEGGYYAWVRRALGPFWGFQEAWLSLMASVFDMAIYPTLFVLYLGRLWPEAATGTHGIIVAVVMIAVCTLWNLGGASAVGDGSVLMAVVLLGPFAILSVVALLRPVPGPAPAPPMGNSDLLGGIMIAMWNYMGWDNASTIAGEVDRPQRTYPLAMACAVALVALTYVLPVAAVSRAGIDPAQWTTGAWVDAADTLAGLGLGIAVVVGAMMRAVGMFNALILSYSRLPLALAEDGYLPPIFARRLASTGAPWVAVVARALAWTAALGLSFERLVILDVLLYGLSLVLEFAALVILRVREPELPRPFRIAGGLPGVVLLGVGPTTLIGLALIRNRSEQMAGINALTIGLALIALGPVVYWFCHRVGRKSSERPTEDRG